MGFAVPFAVGSALVAVWFDCRFEGRRPESPARRLFHAAAAFALLRLSVAVTGQFVDAPALTRLLAVFGILLPAFVYAYLAGVWLMRTLADAVNFARR